MHRSWIDQIRHCQLVDLAQPLKGPMINDLSLGFREMNETMHRASDLSRRLVLGSSERLSHRRRTKSECQLSAIDRCKLSFQL
jgi:hypothetical protein